MNNDNNVQLLEQPEINYYSQVQPGSYRAPDEWGYYGSFGGAYIPEMLYPNVEELKSRYLEIMAETSFQNEYKALLKDYVGRPTPLFFAERLSKQCNTSVYLKREESNFIRPFQYLIWSLFVTYSKYNKHALTYFEIILFL